jgi:hypothetical protein
VEGGVVLDALGALEPSDEKIDERGLHPLGPTGPSKSVNVYRLAPQGRAAEFDNLRRRRRAFSSP